MDCTDKVMGRYLAFWGPEFHMAERGMVDVVLKAPASLHM